MRFQGENSTLSFGLYFEAGRVLLNGTVWLRRPNSAPDSPSPRVRFSTFFSEDEILRLQQWLSASSAGPFVLPHPLRHITRHTDTTDFAAVFDVTFQADQLVPSWWNWAVTSPLTVRLEVRPNELAYLIKALSREHWSTNLTW